MQLKVCGAVHPAEIEAARNAGADLIGLWHGIAGGRADLDLNRLCHLAQLVLAQGRMEPVLVTFESDLERLAHAIAAAEVRAVQLHAFQSPSLVQLLKRRLGDKLRVIKVLHVARGRCLERSLLGTYEQAGIDMFLLDAVTADGRLGSTGQALDPDLVLALADAIARPFFLAGGIAPGTSAGLRCVARHERFLGIDVDSAARDASGRIAGPEVAALRRAWCTTPGGQAYADALS